MINYIVVVRGSVMKTPKTRRNKLFAISFLFIILMLLIGSNSIHQSKASTNDIRDTTVNATADHQLVIFDYSHPSKINHVALRRDSSTAAGTLIGAKKEAG